jgi:hypothetical protein
MIPRRLSLTYYAIQRIIISIRFKPYFGGIGDRTIAQDRKRPWSEVTSQKYVLRMHGFSLRFFSYYSSSTKCTMTDMATGCSENTDVIESTLGVLHNIAKNLENIRKHQKKGWNPTSSFMTSLLVTLTGHVTSGSHVGHGTFCTTTIVRKKP